MVCICNANQALALENEAIAKQKISVEELMDMAGKALANEVARYKPKRPVIIVCGKGNNAGDGFVAARYLNKSNINVKVVALYGADALSKEAFKAYERLPQALVEPAGKLIASLKKPEIIVDAIFGFSFKPPVRDLEFDAIKQINNRKAVVISADVPSGLEASTGFTEDGKVIKASQTVCFSCIKKGLLTDKGPDFAGKIMVSDIGIKTQIINKHMTARAINEEQAKELLPTKHAHIHKKSSGRVLVVGGSSAYTGAPVLTSSAALRSGAGYISLAVPLSIRDTIQQKTTEIVVTGVADNNEGTISGKALKQLLDLSADFDCIALGPGLTTNEETAGLVISFLKKIKNPVVIDADGLNALAVAGGASFLKEIKASVVITPHSGELSRLTGLTVDEVERDRFSAVNHLASNKVTVVLKGRYSLVSFAGETTVNLTSNPGMATAGTGDVLTGVIAAFIAQGLSAEQAAILGTYIHGLAGDIAAAELSEYALIASDVIKYLPSAFKAILESKK